MFAGKRIVRLNFGRRDDTALPILRRVLREARAVTRKEGVTMRVRLPLTPIKTFGARRNLETAAAR